ncbi:MAG: hypothetical protein ACK5NT_14525 [Pyrinomonadaceae bacterium]
MNFQIEPKKSQSGWIFRYSPKTIIGLLALLISTITVYPQNRFTGNQPNQNIIANSSAFKQEIAKLEINVYRDGYDPLPLAKVPRLKKDDVLKVRLLDEPINGVKPDQSNYDWTFLIAYINPGINDEGVNTVSAEVNFKNSGWYTEHAFVVPYDSQPIVFLYPKPKYRSKILKFIKKNHDQIQKVGEKTIEIADAYGRISMFLNELQGVVNRNYYGNYGYYGSYYPNTGGGVHSGNYYSNGYYGNNYYGGYYGNNQRAVAEQAVERLAKSFNIELPNCWNGGASGMQNQPGSYNQNYGYGYYNPYQPGLGNDFIGRVQCVSQSVNIADLDFSISKMFQQGGVLLASQLAQRYPQLAIWINIAATAIDFIARVTNKAPLKLIPTIINTSPLTQVLPGQPPTSSGKFSLFAESQPSDNQFVTAYPIVFNKWQATDDPKVIGLPLPVLMDSCLHVGQNIVRTTDVINDWMNDRFTRDFKLTLVAQNGFQKKFDIKKNIGFGGWELELTKEQLDSIPKINMILEGFVSGSRGFNQIESPRFRVQMGSVDGWQLENTSKLSFSVGGKRRVTLRNETGNCHCLATVEYKPGFGGEFVFNSREFQYSPDDKELSFEIDTTNFSPDSGTLVLHQFGGEIKTIPIVLFDTPPSVSNVSLAKGDRKVTLFGDRLEQVDGIILGGMKAFPISDLNKKRGEVHSRATQKLPSLNERTFLFEDSSTWTGSNEFSLELVLLNRRVVKLPNRFNVSSSRPRLVANQLNEIDGYAISLENPNDLVSTQSLPVLSTETSEVGINLQNALIDQDFRIEQLRLEARIEGSDVMPFVPPDIKFEVLDWRTIRLKLKISEQTRKYLAGKRIQFRIIDSERGNSDWYTLSKTFVRMPSDISVRCKANECVIAGRGITYLKQISLDGGKTWYPDANESLMPIPQKDGTDRLVIPNSGGRDGVRVRLRDFDNDQGFVLNGIR